MATENVDTSEYDARVNALVQTGMKRYDARVMALREDYTKKQPIVMCIKSGMGDVCNPMCSLFGRCWVDEESELEQTSSVAVSRASQDDDRDPSPRYRC